MKRLLITTLFIGTVLLFGCQSRSGVERYSAVGPVSAAIEADINADRLTRPTGHNAMEKIRRLSVISPGHERIGMYYTMVADRLVNLGQQACICRRRDHARQLALRALKIRPGHQDAVLLLEVIEAEQQRKGIRLRPPEMIVIEPVAASSGCVEVMVVTDPVPKRCVTETPISLEHD